MPEDMDIHQHYTSYNRGTWTNTVNIYDGKKKLVLKVAIMTGVTINTHYTCPSETKMRETLLWFCKVPR